MLVYDPLEGAVNINNQIGTCKNDKKNNAESKGFVHFLKNYTT